jgi:hypothetical protein
MNDIFCSANYFVVKVVIIAHRFLQNLIMHNDHHSLDFRDIYIWI